MSVRTTFGVDVKESLFQRDVIEELKALFPGAVVLKTDPSYIQGFPDLLILFENKWAALEVKRGNKASFRPNQLYYIDKLNDMGFAAVIYPENKEEVLHEVQQALRP